MNNIDNFISSLNLGVEFTKSGEEMVANLNSSDEFGNIFDKVAANDNLSLSGNSVATEAESLFVYTDGYFELKLSANYNDDNYIITVEER